MGLGRRWGGPGRGWLHSR